VQAGLIVTEEGRLGGSDGSAIATAADSTRRDSTRARHHSTVLRLDSILTRLRRDWRPTRLERTKNRAHNQSPPSTQTQHTQPISLASVSDAFGGAYIVVPGHCRLRILCTGLERRATARRCFWARAGGSLACSLAAQRTSRHGENTRQRDADKSRRHPLRKPSPFVKHVRPRPHHIFQL
jgi:hypothetical protein